jgi:hypothetical protein
VPGSDRREHLPELEVVLMSPRDRLLVHLLRLTAELRNDRRVRLHLDVALAHLLRVVEGVRVQEAPDELPRDLLQREHEGRVLDRRVMAGVVDALVDAVAQLAGFVVLVDVGRRDDARRIARAGRRDHRVVRILEGADELDFRLGVEGH